MPSEARAVWFYRDEEFHLVSATTRFEEGDEIVVVTHSRHLEELEERWTPLESGSS